MTVVSKLFALMTFVAGCGTAGGAPRDELYQASTVVTGQGEANRASGFAQCLGEVLVKVSGDPRLLREPVTAAIAAQAQSLVRDFRYRDLMAGLPVRDEQGTRDRPYELTVQFHPDEIDVVLRSLGRQPWPAQRPRLMVFVRVQQGGQRFVLSRDENRAPGMREALAAAAAQVGMPTMLPPEDVLVDLGSSVWEAPAAYLPPLTVTARMRGSDAAIAGTLVWSDAALGWIAQWYLRANGTTHQWHVRGVSFDEAFRVAMRGSAQILSGHGRPE